MQRNTSNQFGKYNSFCNLSLYNFEAYVTWTLTTSITISIKYEVQTAGNKKAVRENWQKGNAVIPLVIHFTNGIER